MLNLKILPFCILGLFSFARVGLAISPTFPDENYTERPGTEGNGNIVIGLCTCRLQRRFEGTDSCYA